MRVLILGAGPAGLTAARTLRELAPSRSIDPAITMVSAEPFPPYSPPAMADHFLTGREETLYWQGRDVCDRLRVDYRSGSAVEAVYPEQRQVLLSDGVYLDYDELVIATGSRLHAPLEGYDLPGVYNFKSLAAASELVEHANKGEVRNALIVGAGFIGVEVAVLLQALGMRGTTLVAVSVNLGVALVAAGLSRRAGETVYGVSVVPLGGYVRVTGMHEEEFKERVEAAKEGRTALSRDPESSRVIRHCSPLKGCDGDAGEEDADGCKHPDVGGLNAEQQA